MVMYERSLLVQWPFDGDPTVSVAFCGNKRQFGGEAMDRVAGQNANRCRFYFRRCTRRAQTDSDSDPDPDDSQNLTGTFRPKTHLR